uniref:Uncharacterized protein n=1 Tax=Arundo donax TaxID=35708 RepID=A0A0A9HPU3_ARUDO
MICKDCEGYRNPAKRGEKRCVSVVTEQYRANGGEKIRLVGV